MELSAAAFILEKKEKTDNAMKKKYLVSSCLLMIYE